MFGGMFKCVVYHHHHHHHHLIHQHHQSSWLWCVLYTNKFLQDVYFTNAPYLTIYVVLISQSPEMLVNGLHCAQVVAT